ncbi:MAG: PAS domain S-box protein [Pseudomonadota bacterium]
MNITFAMCATFFFLSVLCLYSLVIARRKTKEIAMLRTLMLRDWSLQEQFIDNAPHGVLLADQDGKITLVNNELNRLFGYSSQELIGQNIEILVPLEQRTKHIKDRHHYIRNDASARKMAPNRVLQGRHRDGHLIPVEVTLAPIVSKGETTVIARVSDISERILAQRIIEHQVERFSIASDAAGIGFWDLDLNSQTLQWDEWMYRLYALPKKPGDQPYDLWAKSVHPDDLNRVEQELDEAINGIKAFDTEFRIIHPSGVIRNIKAIARLTRDTASRPCKMFGINIDITEQKNIEHLQAQLISDLTRINDELNNFTYIASHDLKSPLRGIDQLASWITEDLSDVLHEDTQHHLRLMRSRIKRMEMLLDDLLAYSRIGRSHGDLVMVNTRELVQGVFDLVAIHKPISLHMSADMPILRTQKAPLELVFRNLIDNAVKHHDKAQGMISVSALPVDNGFEFLVTDDGAGIPLEHQKRVFSIFQTLKPRDEKEGSGIGLALVKKAVESRGGNVTLVSDGKSGCTFRFTWLTKE